MASPSSTQPMKKLRAGSTPVSRQPRAKTDVGLAADDAIARRRAELRRLAEQRNKKAASTARGRPAATSANASTSNSRPPTTSAADLMKPSTSLTKTTRSRSTGRAPPPPPVARKLEFNNSGKVVAPAPSSGNSRAKSVPPRRPAAPPRPGSTKRVGGAADGTTKSQELPPRQSALEAAPPVAPTTQQSLPPPTTATDSAPPLVEEIASSSSSKPPVAAKTPAASAKIPVEATPMPSAATTEPPSTSRREKMKQFRAGLESPKTSSSKPTKEMDSTAAAATATINPLASAANVRLEEELKKTEVERNEAFQKIKELEDKLTDISKTTISQKQQPQHATPVKDMTSVQEIMELYKTQGEEAAMQYAQDKLLSQNKQQQPKQAGFLTPVMPSTPSRSTALSHRRAPTPHPNRGLAAKGKAQPTDEDLERRFIATFREAVNFVPHEFYGQQQQDGGQSCVFFVRRPYGLREQNGIFELVSPTVFDAYMKRAHVGDPTTIEVAVGIPFDDSVLCLSGSMGVRYRITPTGAFESKPIVQEPLGSISYIDESANEQEYSLDQIFQEALSVREQYCASMMTTALGFERRKPQPGTPQDGASVAAAPKPEMADAAVDTSDMAIPKEIALEKGKSEKKEEKKSKEESK